jgi:hypothetical protein
MKEGPSGSPFSPVGEHLGMVPFLQHISFGWSSYCRHWTRHVAAALTRVEQQVERET